MKTPFDYLKIINQGYNNKEEIIVDDSVYNQYIINRALSFHLDTIAIVNEINKYGNLSNQMHFDFLRNMVSPRMRFSKWPKPKAHKEAKALSQYYGISLRKAYDLVSVFDEESINKIIQQLEEVE